MTAPSKSQVPQSGGAVSHTLGPWAIHWSINDCHRIVQSNDPDVGYIARVEEFAPTNRDMETEGKANAHLIAAAPDLLEALEAVLVMWRGDPKPRKLDEALPWINNDVLAQKMADDAIAKARGQS